MFLYYLLIITIQALRTTRPSLNIISENIPHTEYKPNLDQTLLLQYNSYPGAYEMKLHKIIDNEFYEMLPNTTLDPFTLSGCYPYERRLLYKELYQQEFESESDFFTALYIDGNQVYVTRSDNQFIIMEIDFDGEQIKNFTQIKMLTIPSKISDEHTIICYNQTCIIFTEYETFLLNVKTEEFQILKMYTNMYPKHVHFCEKLKTLYISYGNDGVDVYLFDQNGNLIYLTKLEQRGNLIETLTNEESTQLYVLDSDLGLLIFDIFTINEYQDTGVVLNLKNAESFDFYENTFIFIAKTDDGDPYAIEVFLQNYDYYFNRIYSKDLAIYDVYVGEYYAVLIGAEIHKVIYHSIYNKFHQFNQIPLFFEDHDLVNVEEFIVKDPITYNKNAFEVEPHSRTNIYYRQAFMVGISDNDINIFTIKSIFPWLQCKPTSTEYEHYQLTMNSTQCNNKLNENDVSPFSQCVVTHNFTMIGTEIYFFEEDETLVITIGSVLGGLIVLLFVGLLFCRRYLNKELIEYSKMNEVQIKVDNIDVKLEPGEDALIS